MSILTLIPARGGSKEVPRKNVKSLAGKPLIAWTIEAALKAPRLSRVIVSTEDAEIAGIARRWGVEVPFLRPVELASDTASAVDVVLHALDWLERHEHYLPELVLLLQPTSPLRTVDDIQAAMALQQAKNAEAVVSVCKSSHPPQWLRCLGPQGELLCWRGGEPPSRRQEAALVYQLNGAIYLVQTSVLKKQKTFCPATAFAYIMPPERSLDIDTPWDFHVADLVLRHKDATPSY